jgi:hypothetical protein
LRWHNVARRPFRQVWHRHTSMEPGGASGAISCFRSPFCHQAPRQFGPCSAPDSVGRRDHLSRELPVRDELFYTAMARQSAQDKRWMALTCPPHHMRPAGVQPSLHRNADRGHAPRSFCVCSFPLPFATAASATSRSFGPPALRMSRERE